MTDNVGQATANIQLSCNFLCEIDRQEMTWCPHKLHRIN